jgi:hypothetical protein
LGELLPQVVGTFRIIGDGVYWVAAFAGTTAECLSTPYENLWI